jgi:squalene synthase HpnC
VRRHLLALYGFARLADFLGDELAGDQLGALDALEADLARAFDGEPRHPLLRELARTIRARGLAREPFLALIEANRRDQCVSRYATWAELADYCACSANPVGRLVLQVFGVATPERVALSDRICTALQLVEHCQDVAEDRARGRVYLPAEDLAACGCRSEDLAAPSAPPALRAVLQLEARRARALLREGEPLLGSLFGAARLAVAGFVAGGHAALDGLERIDFDVLGRRARVRRRDLLRHLASLALRRGGRPA